MLYGLPNPADSQEDEGWVAVIKEAIAAGDVMAIDEYLRRRAQYPGMRRPGVIYRGYLGLCREPGAPEFGEVVVDEACDTAVPVMTGLNDLLMTMDVYLLFDGMAIRGLRVTCKGSGPDCGLTDWLAPASY